MKIVKTIYWITTSIVALMMAYSAIAYITDPKMSAAFHHLGFPSYLRVELAIAKLAGAAVLLLPAAYWIKEWTYAGFVIVFVSASIAHTASGDPAMARMMPIILLLIHLGSYITYRIINRHPEIS